MSARISRLILFSCIGVYVALFFNNYPPIAGIEDEIGFINQAAIWSQGCTSAECAGFAKMPDFIIVDGKAVGWRNPGRSLVLIPFFWLNAPEAIFASGALIHILLTFVCACFFAKINRSPLWSALILFHPTMLLYSRTIMADELAGLFVTLASVSIVTSPSPGFRAGLYVGIAAICRYQTALVSPFLALTVLFATSIQRPWREVARLLVTASAIGAAIVAYNIIVLKSSLGPTHQGYFSLEFVPSHLLHYCASLLFIWPLMLPAIFVRSEVRSAAMAVCLPFLAMISAYYFYDRRVSWAETLIVGQRLILPIIPIWIICYVCMVTRAEAGLKSRWPVFQRNAAFVGRLGVVLGLIVLVATSVLVIHRHQQHLNNLVAAKNEAATIIPPDSIVISNSTFQKLFSTPPIESTRYQFVPIAQEGKYDSSRLGDCWYLATLSKSNEDNYSHAVSDMGMSVKCSLLAKTPSGLLIFECRRLR